jgi:TupA-like ATPgrasp
VASVVHAREAGRRGRLATAARAFLWSAGKVMARRSERIMPEFLVIFFFIMRRHKRRFGVYPNVFFPKTFNEKVLYRMLFDRRPILPRLEDKSAVRDYVREKIGNHVLPAWYFVTTDPSTIPFDDLPNAFVVKPTHGSHWVRLVPDKALLDRQELIETCRSWLAQNYYDITREWAYQHIEPRIAIEEFISDGSGPVPTNYRLYVFGGRVELILADVGTGAERGFAYYSPSWTKLPIPTRKKDVDVARPKHLDVMLRYAELLGSDLEFVRIDMYYAQDKVYFGEATTIPMSGLSPHPHDVDLYLGSLWKLPGRGRRSRAMTRGRRDTAAGPTKRAGG